MMAPEFSVITGDAVHRLLWSDVQGCSRVVERAYLDHHRKRTVNPSSCFLRFGDRPNARIIALAAHVGGDVNASGLKWIASYPDNIRVGLPRASAVIILNDDDTGYPLACLEGSIISAARTAASAVLAARVLSPRPRRCGQLGIVGNGLIARYVYRFLMEDGWEIDRVALCDSDPAEAERFKKHVIAQDRHGDVAVMASPPAVLRESEIVIFATTALEPHVHEAVPADAPRLILHLSLRDLGPGIVLVAQNVVDDVEHAVSANTSLHLAEKQVGHRSFVTATLAEVLTGEKTVDRERLTVFSPFGLGVLDVSVGKWLYDRARAAGDASTMPGFFHDLVR